MSGLIVRVPASTSNLGPGFDCLGLALNIFNDFTVRIVAEGENVLIGRGPLEGAGVKGNPFFVTFERVYREAGHPPPPLQLTVNGAVPAGVGLGSSATAVVAGALTANALLGSPYSNEDLLPLMIEIEGHADNVTPALLGGLTVTASSSDDPIAHVYQPAPGLRVVFLLPDYDMPTAKSRAAMPKKVALADAVYNMSRLPLVIDALVEGDMDELGNVMQDRLHEAERAPRIKRHNKIRRAALEAGAAATFISGAGPAIGAICGSDQAAREALRAMEAACRGAKFRATGLNLQPELNGARIAEI